MAIKVNDIKRLLASGTLRVFVLEAGDTFDFDVRQGLPEQVGNLEVVGIDDPEQYDDATPLTVNVSYEGIADYPDFAAKNDKYLV